MTRLEISQLPGAVPVLTWAACGACGLLGDGWLLATFRHRHAALRWFLFSPVLEC